MKIGFRKWKLQNCDNVLGVKYWHNYKYLGLEFDQGLTFNKIPKTLKQKEIILTNKLRRLNFDVVGIKMRKLVFHSIWAQKLTYGLSWIYGKSKAYSKYIDGLIYRLLKKCFGIRWNPWREKTFELFGVNTEKMGMARKQKFLEVLINKQHCKCKIEVRDGWLPELLNFVLERMMPGFKGSKVCSWGEKLNFKHLVCNCIHLSGWRKRFNKIRSSNYDVFLRQVIRRIKKGDKREVEEANVMAKDFYSTIVQTIVGIWN